MAIWKGWKRMFAPKGANKRSSKGSKLESIDFYQDKILGDNGEIPRWKVVASAAFLAVMVLSIASSAFYIAAFPDKVQSSYHQALAWWQGAPQGHVEGEKVVVANAPAKAAPMQVAAKTKAAPAAKAAQAPPWRFSLGFVSEALAHTSPIIPPHLPGTGPPLKLRSLPVPPLQLDAPPLTSAVFALSPQKRAKAPPLRLAVNTKPAPPAKAAPAMAKVDSKPESVKAAAKAVPAPAPVKPVSKPAPVAVAQATPSAPVLAAASKTAAPAKATTASARVGTGLPLLNKGLTGPNANLHLIALLEASYDKDPSGNTPLSESLCTTPRMYLDALRTNHPNVGLPDWGNGGFQRMIEYIRTWQLVKVDAEMAGDYYTSRVIRPDSGSGCTLDPDWAGGKLREGEMVYVDRNTHEVVARNNCGNIMGKRKPVAPRVASIPAQPRCVEVTFTGFVDRDVGWAVVGDDGPLPPSSCNAQRQGTGSWYAWFGECDDCVVRKITLGYLQAYYRNAIALYQKYRYGVTEEQQTLRFSTAIWGKSLCIRRQDAEGRWSDGVYIHPTGPSAWNGRYRVRIDENLWRPEGSYEVAHSD